MSKLGYIYTLHRWVSLISAVFFLIFCITGIVLLFRMELFGWNQKVVPTSMAKLSYENGWEYLPAAEKAVRLNYPNDKILAAFVQPEEGNILLRIQDRNSDKAVMTMMRMGGTKVAYYPGTDELIDVTYGKNIKTSTIPKVLQVLHVLHVRMGLSKGGDIAVALLCSLILVSIISGILLYGPFMRGRKFAKIGTGTSRSRWGAWHKYLGITAAVWMVVLSVSGLMILGFASTYKAYDENVLNMAKDALHMNPLTSSGITPLQAVESVAAHYPDKYVLSVNYPQGKKMPLYSVYLTRAEEDPDTNYGQPVYLGHNTLGESVMITQNIPMIVHALAIGTDLHIRNHSTPLLRWLWAIFSLINIGVIISGMLIIWRKRHPGNAVRIANETVSAVKNEGYWPFAIGAFTLAGLVFPMFGSIGSVSGAVFLVMALMLAVYKFYK